MDIRQKDKILKDGEVIGHVRRVKVVKNKVAPPFKEALFNIMYPQGIDKESSIVDAALVKGILGKSGSWFKYKEKQLAQGKENVIEEVRKNEALKKKLVADIMATLK